MLIDGWTQPETPLGSDAMFIADEHRVFRRIQEKLKGRAEVLDLVGLKASEKAAISLSVDFFVTPCGTSSLWPSRFARKCGLLHTSEAYFKTSIASQIYSTGSSLYPVESVLPITNAEGAKPASYFMSNALLMNWLNKEFKGLFDAGVPSCPVSRDAILIRAENASTSFKSWCFVADAESRFVFKLNEPLLFDRPYVISMGLSLADPSIGDQVIVLVRTSDGRVLARMRFDAHEFMLGAQKSRNGGEICLTFSVPFVASRLVVRPRQSRGEVSFNSLRVLA